MTVRNVGTGTMPVEIAAVAGDRWAERGAGGADSTRGRGNAYHDSRATVVLGPGASKTVTIRCAFDPDQAVVDPDVRVLQLKRKQAVARV